MPVWCPRGVAHVSASPQIFAFASVDCKSCKLVQRNSLSYRFFCSQFVAGMLLQTGRVTIHDQDYVPIPADWPIFRGTILAAPLLIRLQGPARAAPEGAEGSHTGTRSPHKDVRLVRKNSRELRLQPLSIEWNSLYQRRSAGGDTAQPRAHTTLACAQARVYSCIRMHVHPPPLSPPSLLPPMSPPCLARSPKLLVDRGNSWLANLTWFGRAAAPASGKVHVQVRHAEDDSGPDSH